MGFIEVITVAFIILKVLELIDWSWWLVFTPMIATYSLALLAAIFFSRK